MVAPRHAKPSRAEPSRVITEYSLVVRNALVRTRKACLKVILVEEDNSVSPRALSKPTSAFGDVHIHATHIHGDTVTHGGGAKVIGTGVHAGKSRAVVAVD